MTKERKLLIINFDDRSLRMQRQQKLPLQEDVLRPVGGTLERTVSPATGMDSQAVKAVMRETVGAMQPCLDAARGARRGG